MAWFTLDLDDITEEIFYRLEHISNQGRGHYCDIKADSRDEATNEVLEGLRSFIREAFHERH